MTAQSATNIIEQLSNNVVANNNNKPPTQPNTLDQVDSVDAARMQQQIAHMQSIQQQASQPHQISDNNIGALLNSYQTWMNNMNNYTAPFGYFGQQMQPPTITGSQQQQQQQLSQVSQATAALMSSNLTGQPTAQQAANQMAAANSNNPPASQFGLMGQPGTSGVVTGGGAAGAGGPVMIISNQPGGGVPVQQSQSTASLQQQFAQTSQLGQFGSIATQQTPTQTQQLSAQQSIPTHNMQLKQQQQQPQQHQLAQAVGPQQLPAQIHHQLQKHMPSMTASFNGPIDAQFGARFNGLTTSVAPGSMASLAVAGVPGASVAIAAASNYSNKLEELFFRYHFF